MTEQDKQALIEYYCQRDCGHTREECCLDNCHEIMLIEEFPITPTDADTISRQAAIDALNKLSESTYEVDYGVVDCDDAINAIAALPPTEPKKGKWIKTARWGRVYYCNQCRNYLDFDGVNAGRGSTNFCPNCGAEMEVTE